MFIDLYFKQLTLIELPTQIADIVLLKVLDHFRSMSALLPAIDTNPKMVQHAAVPSSLARYRSRSGFNPPPPWFGIDIGGTLVKLVYFEPEELTAAAAAVADMAANAAVSAEDSDDAVPQQEQEHVTNLRKYLTSTTAYGQTGRRDEHLELKHVRINGIVGTLHFLRFPTLQMDNFLKMAREKQFSKYSSTGKLWQLSQASTSRSVVIAEWQTLPAKIFVFFT